MPVIFICEYCGHKDYHPTWEYEGWMSHMLTFSYQDLEDVRHSVLLCYRHVEDFKKLKGLVQKRDKSGRYPYWKVEVA